MRCDTIQCQSLRPVEAVLGKVNSLLPLFSMSDEQAMWRVQSTDDNAAFGHLVQRWEQPILRLCARMTGNLHQAEDLKQETFTRIFIRRKDFRQGARFSTWLWRIALNLCYDELRKRQRQREVPLENGADDAGYGPEPASDEPSPDVRLAAREECELVGYALLRLSEAHRAVLVLRYCEGLKLREIADILEIPETTASSRIAVGLAQITRLLEPQFGETKGKS
jgi:RNA polymerase sigma-70 factor, ECF subfamily